ncbi:MAG: translocation/assembly module TamB domain-containing protein [Paracoccus sp. (in: a-proteobacteria)]
MLRRILLLLAVTAILPLAAIAQDSSDEAPPLAEVSEQESDDKGFLTRFLQSRLSSAGRSVTIDGFRGALSSRATFDRIAIADAEGIWLTLHDGAIQWNRSALLRGRVEIGELTADLIEIPRAPAGDEEKAENNAEAGSFSFELPELPVGIDIKKLDANRVVLGTPLIGEDADISVMGSMSLSDGEGMADLVISRIDGKKGEFVFTGSFDNDSRILNIDLSLDEDPDGIFSRIVRIEGQPAVTARIQGEGPLSDYKAEAQIATDGVERITGSLSFLTEEDAAGVAGNRFDLTVGGDIATLLPPENREFFGNQTQILASGWRADTGRLEIEALSFDTDALKINGRLATNDQAAPEMLDLEVAFGQQASAKNLPVRIPFLEPPVSVLSGQLTLGYDAAEGSDWSLQGWLSEIDRDGSTRVSRLGLDGSGQVTLANGGSLQQVDGILGFDAGGIELPNPQLQQVIGNRIIGSTSFDFTPGEVLELSRMRISGKDYALGGGLIMDGLASGIVLSSNDLVASHDDLSNLSALAGRDLSGKARAELAGFYQALTGAFDIEGMITGTDLSVDDKRLDHLLAGDSTIGISASRTEDGTELRDLRVNAHSISLNANGLITNDAMHLVADVDIPTLTDISPDLDGTLKARAQLSGPAGGRMLTLTGQASGLKTGVSALDHAFAGNSDLNASLQEIAAGGFSLTNFLLENDQLELFGAGTIDGSDVDARFDFDVSDLSAFGDNFGGVLDTTINIATDAGLRQINVTGTGHDILLGQTNLNGAFTGETQFLVTVEQGDDRLKIADAQVSNDQLEARASGVIAGEETDVQAQVRITSLAPLGRNWSGALSANAGMTEGQDGTRHIRIDATGQDIAFGQENTDAPLSGQTDIAIIAEQQPETGVLALRSFDLHNPQMTATASGQMQGRAIDGQAVAQIEDLASLGLGWSGSLNANARIATDEAGTRQVEVDGSGQDIRLGPAQAGAPRTGQTDISIRMEQTADRTIRIYHADIANDQMMVSAEGNIGMTGTDARAQVQLRNMASFGLGLQGALDINATIADTGDGGRRLSVTGTGQDLAFGPLDDADARSGTVTIDLMALDRDGGYMIERAHLLGDQLQVRAGGAIGTDGTDVRAMARINDLSMLGLGMAGAFDGAATLKDDSTGMRDFNATGTVIDLALRRAGLENALSGDTRFVIDGRQGNDLIMLDTAQLEHPDLSASATGQYGEGQSDLDATVHADDLGFLGGGAGGALTTDIKVTDDAQGRHFDVSGQAFDLRVGNTKADAALAGETRILVRALQGDDGAIRIEDLQAENPQFLVNGQGAIDAAGSQFDLEAGSHDLSFLGPGYTGAMEVIAQLHETGGIRNFEIRGTGTNVATGITQIDAALDGVLDFDAKGIQTGNRIQLDEAQARTGLLAASASGIVASGQTDLAIDLAASDLGFVTPGLTGHADVSARITDQSDGRRITAEVVASGLGMGNNRVDALLAGDMRVGLTTRQGPDSLWIERLDARNTNIRVLADGDPAQGLNLDASLADLQVLVPGINGPAQAVGTVQQVDGGARMDIAITGPGGTRGQLAGVLAGVASDLRMSGISDAAVVNPILRTRSVEGPVTFDLRLQGPPGLDSLTGQLTLTGGRLAEPRIGLTMDHLNLDAQLQNGLIGIDLGGGLRTGGSVAVDGSIDLRSGRPELDLTARLDQAVLRDPNLYELVADGTVSVTGIAADGPLVSGAINIVEAEFQIPSTGLGGVQAIPDMVHVNDSWQSAATRAKAGIEPYGSAAAEAAGLGGPAATPPQNPARFDLTINAPNQVFIRGRGVDAELGGETRLTGNARQPVPVGHLSLIRGRVDLLGKRFDLNEGLIELQGSLIPVIRLVATHVEDAVSIRIVIDGEVRDPDITFESDPPLPEEEVLSYLLFGQGLDQITPLQAAQLANALAVLAGKGGIGVVGNIREVTGLDDLDMTIDDEGDVAVRAGKYLTRNIYTDIELGGDGKTQVNLNLDLNDAITARGSADNEGDSTLGLYFEKDY